MAVALVTGASRGIGAACAVHLGRAGFDVAITARTFSAPESREYSTTVHRSEIRTLPGSLIETATEVEAQGGRALPIVSDLLDPSSLEALVSATIERFGRIDVLVNNAIYMGPGHQDLFVDTSIDLLELQLAADLLAPLRLIKLVLGSMIANGGGKIINLTSFAGYADPLALPGEGGWGLGYAMAKAALGRVGGCLSAELAAESIECFTVQPGAVDVPRRAVNPAVRSDAYLGAPPDAVGAVVAWLASSSESTELLGTTIEAQFVCAERGLLPGWHGPRPLDTSAIRFDQSGSVLQQLERELADQWAARR